MTSIRFSPSMNSDFAALSKKYNHFFVPAFRITIGSREGAKPDREVRSLHPPAAISDLSVHRTVNQAGSFSFTMDNPARISGSGELFPFLEKDGLFQPDRNVRIEMGYGSALEEVISGSIESIRASFDADGRSKLTVTGFDRLRSLMKRQASQPASWGSDSKQMTYGEIVKEIAKKYGLSADVDDMGEKRPKEKQDEGNDYDFIANKLAKEIGFEVYVDRQTLHFHSPRTATAEIVTGLEWGKSLISFNPVMEGPARIGCIEVRGWNPDKQEAVVGTAGPGGPGAGKFGAIAGGALRAGAEEAVEHVWRPDFATAERVKRHAGAILAERSRNHITGEGECLGIPEIKPGTRIKLSGLGSRFDKAYYVTDVNHSINSSGYLTRFEVTETTPPD
jgi:phage protein D